MLSIGSINGVKRDRFKVEVKLRPLEPRDRLAGSQVLKSFGVEKRKAVRKATRIRIANPEHDSSVRVGKDRARHVAVSTLQLPQILVRKHETEAILASAR